MDEHPSKPLRQALWQTPALVALAVLVAIGVNHFRSDGIPLIGDWSAHALFVDAEGRSLVISLEQARDLFQADEVLFVDARPKYQCDDGRIQGALCIPWQDVDRYFFDAIERLEEGKTIIAYCDGEACDLSHELVLFLQDMGFPDAFVLVNGWTVWKRAGLPTEGG